MTVHPIHASRFGPLTLAALVVSASGLVIATAWALSTLVLAEPILPFWPLICLFILIFPLHLRTVLGVSSLWRDRRGSPRSRLSPTDFRALKDFLGARLAVTGYAVFIGYWLLAMSSFIWLAKGNPEKHGDRFYANDHGSLTEISGRTYHHLQLAEQRLFAAIPAAFFLIALLYNVGVTRREGSACQSPRRR